MLNRLRDLGFTKQDLIIISFLLAAFAGGLIIKFSGWKPADTFDYSAGDKAFEQHVNSAFSELDSKPLSTEQEEKLRSLKKFSDSLYTEKESSPKEKPELPAGKKININTAYAKDFEALPGIGEIMAERIVEYREQKKGFKKIEDIMNVKGIGEKKFEKIKDYVVVE